VPFIKVSSPFNFTVENQTLPVGDYTISGSAVHAQSVIWLQSSNGKHIAVVSTHPRYALDPSARTQLTFQHSGGEYFLSQLWTRGGSSGHDVQLSNRAKGLAGTARAATLRLSLRTQASRTGNLNLSQPGRAGPAPSSCWLRSIWSHIPCCIVTTVAPTNHQTLRD